MPLCVVENEHFRRFMNDVDKKYVLPSRSHITSKLVPEIYEKKKELVSSKLSASKHVALPLTYGRTVVCIHFLLAPVTRL